MNPSAPVTATTSVMVAILLISYRERKRLPLPMPHRRPERPRHPPPVPEQAPLRRPHAERERYRDEKRAPVEATVAVRAGHDWEGQQAGGHHPEGDGRHGRPQFGGDEQAVGPRAVPPREC